MTVPSATAIAPAPSRYWRRCAWLLALLITVKAMYMAFFLTPPGDLPDESGHYSYVRDIAHGKFFPLLGEATIPRNLWFEPPPSSRPPQSVVDRLVEGMSTADVQKPEKQERPNYIVQHPPLYYAVTAIPYAITERWTDNRWYQVRSARIVSAVSLGLLVIVLFGTLTDLGVAPLRALPLAAAVGFIPTISHLASGITNDIFLFLLCALATRHLARYLMAQRLPDAYLCALWLTLAGGTKMTAWPLIAGYLAVLLFEMRQPLRRWFMHAGGLSLLALALPLWWAARNIRHFGNPMQVNVVTNQPLYLNYSVLDYLKGQPFFDWMMVHSYGLIGFAGFCQTPERIEDCVGVKSTRIANHAFEFALWALAVLAAAMLAHTVFHYIRQFRTQAKVSAGSLQGWTAHLLSSAWLRAPILLVLGAAGMLMYVWGLQHIHREGELGWLINAVLLMAAPIALMGLGVALFDDRADRRLTGYALALFFCYGMLIAYQSHKAYVLVAELRGVQGRYFYPFVPVLLASAGLVLERLRVPAVLTLWLGLGLAWGELHSYITQVIPFFELVRV
jgi:hypothetical protein